jgi:hypothetical protein
VFENMIALHLINKSIFSVYLSKEDENTGEILFGRIETSYMASNF